jgi:SAM-dependent methyltransferase
VSIALYDASLRDGSELEVHWRGGERSALGIDRWRGPARGADAVLLARARGTVLDVGCGPGRLLAALRAHGVCSLGVDIAPEAVAIARRSGGTALLASVFDPLPAEGGWDTVLLADGNIGIGGNPQRLLRRSAQLLATSGELLVEVGAPGSGSRRERVHLHDATLGCGAWFPWATLAADLLADTAAEVGLQVVEQWSASERDDAHHAGGFRWFAALTHR